MSRSWRSAQPLPASQASQSICRHRWWRNALCNVQKTAEVGDKLHRGIETDAARAVAKAPKRSFSLNAKEHEGGGKDWENLADEIAPRPGLDAADVVRQPGARHQQGALQRHQRRLPAPQRRHASAAPTMCAPVMAQSHPCQVPPVHAISRCYVLQFICFDGHPLALPAAYNHLTCRPLAFSVSNCAGLTVTFRPTGTATPGCSHSAICTDKSGSTVSANHQGSCSEAQLHWRCGVLALVRLMVAARQGVPAGFTS